MLAPAQQPFSAHHSNAASYTPVIVVLVVIACLSFFACVLRRVCSRERNGTGEENPCDLEKGLSSTAKLPHAAARLKNKDANATNVIDPKKLSSVKTAAALKKQGPGRCELHGVYLARNANLSDVSGANGEDRSSVNSN